ncbi:unnamed protein product [Euphydryas editha]|uniref:Uncharacterized protein n=1 Tax=Euphydryas editha TaxID=104508 RepID=A0AAU9U582_EUPED|nr:unnamed protein product [Euphydryas editha]
MRINHLYDWVQLHRKNKFQKNPGSSTPIQVNKFKKKRGKTTIDVFRLSVISKEALPISAEKKRDLINMIDLIDDSFKEFYIKIKTVNDVSAPTDPDLDKDNPDEEDSEVL